MKKTGLNPGEKRLADQDYWAKLSEADKEWLNQFNQEYYQGIYKEEDRKIHPEKFDASLKEARSARRKDIAYMNMIDDKFGEEGQGLNNVSDNNIIHHKTRIQKIGCYFDKPEEALEFLRLESVDIIKNDDDICINEILLQLQKESIAVIEFMRKNP